MSGADNPSGESGLGFPVEWKLLAEITPSLEDCPDRSGDRFLCCLRHCRSYHPGTSLHIAPPHRHGPRLSLHRGFQRCGRGNPVLSDEIRSLVLSPRKLSKVFLLPCTRFFSTLSLAPTLSTGQASGEKLGQNFFQLLLFSRYTEHRGERGER